MYMCTRAQERPDLANLKSQLVVSNAKMKKELGDIENRILQLLSASSGNILDDEELINTLAQSKVGGAGGGAEGQGTRGRRGKGAVRSGGENWGESGNRCMAAKGGAAGLALHGIR